MSASKASFTLSLVAMMAFVVLVPGPMIASQWWQAFQLTTHGVRVPAVITALEPNNHRAVHYTFNADGISVQTFGQGGIDGRFDDLKVGQVVTAQYLPSNPRTSRLGDPRQEFLDYCLLFVLFLLVVIALLFFYPFRKHAKA
jgi:hypothetical protein